MLEIGIIIPQLVKYGGAERFAAECIAYWQQQHRITLYTAEYSPAILQEYSINKIRIVKLSPPFQGEHSVVLNGTLLPKIWEQEIGTHAIYLAHLWPTHQIDRHPMVWFPHEPPRMLRDLMHAVPLDDLAIRQQRQTLHCYPKFSYDYETDHRYEAALNTLAQFDTLGKPDRIVANSHYTAAHLQSVYGRPIVDVVYPGVANDRLPTAMGNEPLFLAVGQLWPHKRTRLIIEALSLTPDVQLNIVGDGPEYQDLYRMVNALNLSTRVTFWRQITNQQLGLFYQQCRAVIFAAVNEPFGIVPIEALAAARPLISAGEGGYTELINERCAFRVMPHPEAIAEKMAYLRDHPEAAATMGQIGFEQVRRFTWERTATQLLQILTETADQWYTLPHRQSNRLRNPPPQWPLLGAQVYCWYGHGAGSRHWNDNREFGGVTDMPALGYYASSDGLVIAQQLEAMNEAGINFAILNLHVDANGLNEYEWASAKRILSIADRHQSPLQFAIQLCLYDPSREHLIETLRHITQLSQASNYFKMEGQPVLFIFWNGLFDRDLPMIELLSQHTPNFTRIASSVRCYSAHDEPRKTFHLFHGWSLFSPLELASAEKWETIWHQAYQNAHAGSKELRIATVSPGYDDTHLLDTRRINNPYRQIDRQQGKIYQQTLTFALQLNPPPQMVIISTYNEYHENTHIEASHQHGLLYMQQTQAFAHQLRARWRQTAA